MAREIEIDGIENVRDLGGLINTQGEILQQGQYFRGAALHHITPTGMAKMKELGIGHIIDLRSKAEAKENPDPEFSYPIEQHHIPMLDQLHSNMAVGSKEFPTGMDQVYFNLLDHYQESLKETFTVLAEADSGVFFHCTAGKDRTGTVAMLLLGLAGVSDDEIVADYALTKTLAGFNPENRPEVPNFIFEARPIWMDNTLHWLEEKYESVPNYLEMIGVSKKQREAICKKFGVTVL